MLRQVPVLVVRYQGRVFPKAFKLWAKNFPDTHLQKKFTFRVWWWTGGRELKQRWTSLTTTSKRG